MTTRAGYLPPLHWERLALDEKETRDREHARLRSIASERLARNAADLSHFWPNLGAGPITAGALSGLQPDSPQMQAMALRELELAADSIDRSRNSNSANPNSDDNSVFGWSALKGISRAATLTFEGLWEEVLMRPLRTAVGVSQGMSAGDAWSAAGSSDALSILTATFAGDQVNTGSGFFARSNLSDETQRRLDQGEPFDQAIRNDAQSALGVPITQQARQQRESGIQITGSNGVSVPVSPGRLLALTVTEPGTKPFNLISGIADASAQVFLDPTNLLFLGAGKFRTAANALVPDGARKTFLSRTWEDYLTSRDGQDVARALAGQNDKIGQLDAEDIYGFLKGSQGNVDTSVYADLVDASKTFDPNEVTRVLLSHKEELRPTTFAPTTVSARLSDNLLGTSFGGSILQRPGAVLAGRALGGAVAGGSAAVRGLPQAAGRSLPARAALRPIQGTAAGVGAALGGFGGALGVGSTARRAGELSRISSVGVGVSSVARDTYLGWLSAEVGARALSARDLDQSLFDWRENMRLMELPREVRVESMERMARAQSAPAMFGVVRDGVEAWAGNLKAQGFNDTLVESISRLYERHAEFRAFWLDRVGQAQYFPAAPVKMNLNGEVVALPAAHLFSEMMEQMIPILDPRNVRKAVRKADRQGKAARAAVSASDWEKFGNNMLKTLGDGFLNRVWKPFVLLRVAWPVRVIGEEQLRLAATGMTSIFRHPLQHISMVMAGKTAEDVYGRQFRNVDEWERAMSSRGLGFIDRVHWNNHVPWRKAEVGRDPRAFEGLFIELQKQARDPVSVAIARRSLAIRAEAGDAALTERGLLDVLKEEFFNGGKGTLGDVRRQLVSEGGRMGAYQWRVNSDGLIDSYWARMHGQFGGDYVFFQRGGVLDKADAVPAGSVSMADPVTRDELTVHSDGRWYTSGGVRMSDDQIAKINLGLSPHSTVDPQSVENLETVTTRTKAILDDVLGSTGMGSRDFTGNQEEMSALIGRLDDLIDSNRNIIDNEDFDKLTELRDLVFDVWENRPSGASLQNVRFTLRDRFDDFFDNVLPRYQGAAGVPPSAHLRPDLVGQRFGNVERTPTDEALRLAELTRTEFEDAFSTIDQVDRLAPIFVRGIPDGTHHFRGGVADSLDPELVARESREVQTLTGRTLRSTREDGSSTQRNVVIHVREGRIVAQMDYRVIVEPGGATRLDRMGVLSSADEAHYTYAQAGDAQRMLKEVFDTTGEDFDASSLLNLVLARRRGHGGFDDPVRPVSLGELLSTVGVDTEGLRSTEEILAAVRASLGEGDPFPRLGNLDSTEMLTRDGAGQVRATLKDLTRARGSTDSPHHATNWPLHREQYQLTRAGDAEVIEAIATGRWRGTVLRDFIDDDTGEALTTSLLPGRRGFETTKQKVISELEESLGERLKGQFFSVPDGEPEDLNQWDQVIDALFDLLMSKPTDRLSRSPAFQQYYWRRMSQVIGELDPADQAKALKQMRAQGVTRRTVREWAGDVLKGKASEGDIAQLDRLAGPGFNSVISGSGTLSLAEADDIAKAFALHETKELLYDVSRKHNFFDITRHIFPFGEAWLEIITRWATITRNNPRVIRRVDQAINGARDNGFFYNDPNTGDEVFNYPGSGLLSKWMFGSEAGGILGQDTRGTGVQLTAGVQNLNLMLGSFMPGVGPIVQIPASTIGRPFLEQPNQKFMRELLLPFGFQDIDSSGDILDALAPAWFRKFSIAFLNNPTGDDQRLFDNTVIDVLRVMDQTGQVNLSTREGYQAALKKAQAAAQNVYRFRAASQFAGPTGAGVRFQTEDVRGRVWAFTTLATEYRRILEDNQFNEFETLQEFVRMYGINPSGLLTPKTNSLRRRSTTERGDEFEALNPELFSEFPNSAYYARPDNVDEDFYYPAYLRQIREGTRQALKPEQWIQEQNNFLGRLAYERAKRTVGDRTDFEARRWLNAYRLELMERYEGYNSPILGVAQKPNRDALIREFEQWQFNPAISQTDAGQGIAQYMRARELAQREMVAQGFQPSSLATSQAGQVYRDWLRTQAQNILLANPSFGPVWVEVFSREIEEDELVVDDFSSAIDRILAP